MRSSAAKRDKHISDGQSTRRQPQSDHESEPGRGTSGVRAHQNCLFGKWRLPWVTREPRSAPRLSGGTKALTLRDSLHAFLDASVHYRTPRHPKRGSFAARFARQCPMSDLSRTNSGAMLRPLGPGIARQFSRVQAVRRHRALVPLRRSQCQSRIIAISSCSA